MAPEVDEARRDLVGALRLVRVAWAKDIEQGKRDTERAERSLATFASASEDLATTDDRIVIAEAIANLRHFSERFPKPVAALVALGIARLQAAICSASMPGHSTPGPGWSANQEKPGAD